MNLIEAEQVYSYHVKRTEDLITSMGDNPTAINAVITHTYASLAEKEPSFLWFSVGAIVSSSVGKNLDFAKQAFVNTGGQGEASKIIWDNLSQGNQKIFKDILPLFFTCQQIGSEGIKLLTSSASFSEKMPLLKAFENYAVLQSHQVAIATSLGLPLNDPAVIQKLFLDKDSKSLAHLIAMGVAEKEQEIVQSMYETDLTEIMLDPTLTSLGHLFKLDEISILDKKIVFSDYVDNPADIDQRLKLAEILFKRVGEVVDQGQLPEYQIQVSNAAAQTLWSGNPYVTPLKSSEANEAYWGQEAEKYDNVIKEKSKAFTNQEPSPVENDAKSLLSSVFTGEHEIVKVNLDPLALFLANNPDYTVITHDFDELMASHQYFRKPFPGGVVMWHPDRPYLQNDAYLAIYNNGEYQYYQPQGEVRGITFPFMYDQKSGTPLTKPLYDDLGHYDHSSTIDAIYNNPEIFNTPSHINWYNPYWNALVAQARAAAFEQYVKAITIDRVMNAIVAPPSYGFEINIKGKSQIALNGGDLFQLNSNSIDFSSLPQNNAGTTKLVIDMTLANGTVFTTNNEGNFKCSFNCQGPYADILESAANTVLHQTFG